MELRERGFRRVGKRRGETARRHDVVFRCEAVHLVIALVWVRKPGEVNRQDQPTKLFRLAGTGIGTMHSFPLRRHGEIVVFRRPPGVQKTFMLLKSDTVRHKQLDSNERLPRLRGWLRKERA